MDQNLITLIIVFATACYVLYSIVKSLTGNKASKCDGCSGCELKQCSLKNEAGLITPKTQFEKSSFIFKANAYK